MTYLIATHSVVVVRDNKQRTIRPGEGIDFTDEEIVTIRKANPAGLRAPVSESEAPAAAAAQADEDEDI